MSVTIQGASSAFTCCLYAVIFLQLVTWAISTDYSDHELISLTCCLFLFPFYSLLCLCLVVSRSLCVYRLVCCWTVAVSLCLTLVCCCAKTPRRPVGCAPEVVSTDCFRRCLYERLWSSLTFFVFSVCVSLQFGLCVPLKI